MVSFVASRGLKAFLTVMMVVQTLILSIRFDADPFSFFRFHETAVTTHAGNIDKNRLDYKYVAATTTLEKSNTKEELRGGITKQLHDTRVRGLQDRSHTEVLRMLQPKDEKDEDSSATKNAKETKAPTVKETKAPTVKETKAPTVKETKAPKNTKALPAPSSEGKRTKSTWVRHPIKSTAVLTLCFVL
jgi:outer membrane biosynthesis protein TonB